MVQHTPSELAFELKEIITLPGDITFPGGEEK
ncbi:hypothetical protein SMICM17S_05418 [Streptomyces microflavus]